MQQKAYMPLLIDCIAANAARPLQDEGMVPLRLLLNSDMICRLGQPDPPHSEGRLPEMLLFCMFSSLHMTQCQCVVLLVRVGLKG